MTRSGFAGRPPLGCTPQKGWHNLVAAGCAVHRPLYCGGHPIDVEHHRSACEGGDAHTTRIRGKGGAAMGKGVSAGAAGGGGGAGGKGCPPTIPWQQTVPDPLNTPTRAHGGAATRRARTGGRSTGSKSDNWSCARVFTHNRWPPIQSGARGLWFGVNAADRGREAGGG